MRVTKILLFLFFFILFQNTRGQQVVSVNLQFFYDRLSPYGNWISGTPYGYVWQPRVARGFRPYLDRGYWAWTDEYQWIWISEYDWGWAPFHYGRWYYDNFYGWLWVPGYTWSPAWVAWRSGTDYYGWSPLSPDILIGVDFSYDTYNPPYYYWVFVNPMYLTMPHLNHYCHPVMHNQDIIAHTQSRPTVHFVDLIINAPSKKEVESHLNKTVPSMHVKEYDQPTITSIQKNEITIFKPKADWSDKKIAAPKQATPMSAKTIEPIQEIKVTDRNISDDKNLQNNIPQKTVPNGKDFQQVPSKVPPKIKQVEKNIPEELVPKHPLPPKDLPIKREPIRNEPIKRPADKLPPGKKIPRN